ncbi:gas vesicle protein GvpH [Halopenitus sp. H-Gu1]|uniref:gas vesicle protein GvpH n=1 Tax=Halopenitus sp. H-Gu1 TaxID=3242697 RepID=UPI00359D507B
MASDHNNTDDTSDKSDSSSDPSGLLGQLQALIEALAEIEEDEGGYRQGSGRIDRGSTRIDYSYDVSIGLGPDDRTASPRDQPVSDRSRTEERTRSQQGDEESIRIETREISNDERVVIADLPGVTDDELDVTLDADDPALELWANEELVERVALDQPDVTITDVALNNQILEIRLTRASESNDGESE